MKLDKKKIRDVSLILFYILTVVIIVLFFYFYNVDKNEEVIYSMKVRGYSLDNEFDPNIHEYNLVVTDNIVEISCDSNVVIEGCNVSLDLTDKKKYSHVIKVFNGKKTIEYVINIKNETKIEDKDFYIKEVKGNTFDWINSDIVLEVIISSEGNYLYSFDSGQTWQESNKFTVSENNIFKIVAKNVDGRLTNIKSVEVDRIDKEAPQVVINKLNIDESKVTLEVIAYDSSSGVDSISFNGNDFSDSNKYDVNKTGNYYVQVKDKAGNITDKLYVEIKDEDFKKEAESEKNGEKKPDSSDKKEEDKVKTFTLTLKGNGSTLTKNSISCTTTENMCQVILPKIITNHIALGWSKDSKATIATYSPESVINLTGNSTLYAITKKEYTVTFNKNGATDIGSYSLSCTAYNNQKCEIVTPSITTTGSVIGWSENSNSKNANISINQKIELTSNVNLYAITKKEYTATFNKNGATSIESNSLSCTAYNGNKCEIITPAISGSGTIIGWGNSASSTTSKYGIHQKIELTSNVSLYAITKKEYTATFNKNGATSIESNSLSCTAYNGNKCEIITPAISGSGTIIGWGNSASSTTSKYGIHQKIELTSNVSLYAITKKQYTATFNKNGATSIGSSSLSCTAYNGNKCEIIMPSITTSGTVIGWGDSASSTTAKYRVNQKTELTNNVKYYAITKKTFKATFNSAGLSYLSASSLSCDVYNTANSCEIILPYFNKIGHFNSFWSTKTEVSSNLVGKNWTWKYFNQAGRPYKLTSNITLYPNFNHFHYDLSKNYYKYRSFSISSTKTVGNTIFEFESGIPQTAINNFISSMNTAYRLMPWLFTQGKVFVMTESTYNNYSIAYGLTHAMYDSYGGDSYFTIDLKYDTSGAVVKNAIDVNAALHELGHAWDSYYNFKTGSGEINATSDFDNFYNSISSKLYIDSSGDKISKVETFAGMVTNYYWHVLGADRSKSHYALKSGYTLNSAELNNLKIFMQKYINVANNGY